MDKKLIQQRQIDNIFIKSRLGTEGISNVLCVLLAKNCMGITCMDIINSVIQQYSYKLQISQQW